MDIFEQAGIRVLAPNRESAGLPDNLEAFYDAADEAEFVYVMPAHGRLDHDGAAKLCYAISKGKPIYSSNRLRGSGDAGLIDSIAREVEVLKPRYMARRLELGRLALSQSWVQANGLYHLSYWRQPQ